MLYPLLDFDPPENWTKQQWGLPSSIEAFTHKREKSVEVLYTQAHQEDPLLEEWLKVEYKKEIRTEESEVDALLRNLFDTAYSTK